MRQHRVRREGCVVLVSRHKHFYACATISTYKYEQTSEQTRKRMMRNETKPKPKPELKESQSNETYEEKYDLR